MASLTRRAFLRTGAAAGVVGALAGCTAPAASSGPGEEWAQYRFDATRTGYNPATGGPEGEVGVRWTVGTEDRVVSPPVVTDGRVFVNSDAIAALDADDGTGEWTKPVFYRSGSAAAVADGVLFVASRFALWALDARDGAERWSATFGRRILGAPAVADGTVYVVSSAASPPIDSTVHALALEDGTERWRAPVGESALPPFVPAVADGRVYVGLGTLFALDADDGSRLWTATPDGTFGTPAVADDRVYAGARRPGNLGAVFAYDAADGTEEWRFETGKSARSLAVAADEIYVASDAVYALSAADGTERWRFDSNRYVLAAPAVTTERVYVAGLLGTVRALDRADGEESWLVETPSVVFSAPAVVGDAVFVGGSDRTVYAFS